MELHGLKRRFEDFVGDMGLHLKEEGFSATQWGTEVSTKKSGQKVEEFRDLQNQPVDRITLSVTFQKIDQEEK